jgi:hypothetical protein
MRIVPTVLTTSCPSRNRGIFLIMHFLPSDFSH